jgi:hypothetical protein
VRYRVDFPYRSWISFDERDAEKAIELYKSNGVRLRMCDDLHDEGTVIAGLPLGAERLRGST